MAEQVTLPAVGPVSKRALWLGGGAAVVVMAVLWWRRRNSTPTPAVDPNAVDPNAVDTSGMAGGGGSLTGPNLPAVSNPVSNPQWTALVMQQLSGVADPSALAQALGLYLTGGPVTVDQEHLIDQAIAVAGYPPVAGPAGYPPGIRTQPAGGQTPAPMPTPTPAPGPTPTPGPVPVNRYTIQHGDTLSSIARKFNTTVGQLLAWNLPALDAYARKFGHPNSNNGNLIFGGLPIRVG